MNQIEYLQIAQTSTQAKKCFMVQQGKSPSEAKTLNERKIEFEIEIA